MSLRPPQMPTPVLMPVPYENALPYSVGIATYRTPHELNFYLRALSHASGGRIVVVLGLRNAEELPVAELPPNARLFLTSEAPSFNAARSIGWFVPDPLNAVILAMTGLAADEGIVLLFPHDWRGPKPEALVDAARRWRSSPHSPNDDAFFSA